MALASSSTAAARKGGFSTSSGQRARGSNSSSHEVTCKSMLTCLRPPACVDQPDGCHRCRDGTQYFWHDRHLTLPHGRRWMNGLPVRFVVTVPRNPLPGKRLCCAQGIGGEPVASIARVTWPRSTGGSEDQRRCSGARAIARRRRNERPAPGEFATLPRTGAPFSSSPAGSGNFGGSSWMK